LLKSPKVWVGSGHATKVYRCVPQRNLLRAITARRNQYEKELMAENIKHYRREVKPVVAALHRKGEYRPIRRLPGLLLHRLVIPLHGFTK
jgi:hypothetical protein